MANQGCTMWEWRAPNRLTDWHLWVTIAADCSQPSRKHVTQNCVVWLVFYYLLRFVVAINTGLLVVCFASLQLKYWKNKREEEFHQWIIPNSVFAQVADAKPAKPKNCSFYIADVPAIEAPFKQQLVSASRMKTVNSTMGMNLEPHPFWIPVCTSDYSP